LGSASSSAASDHLAGAVEIDIDRQRLRHADGIGQLDGAALGKAGGDAFLAR
jgi:hypothetical protein